MELKPLALIAEDSEMDLQILQALLEKQGYDVVCGRNGQEAWDILEAHREAITVAFVDLTMPVMDGFQLIGKIREDFFTRNLPVVVTTSHTEQDFVLKTVRLKVNGFMGKPVSVEKLNFHLDNLENERITGTEIFRQEVIFDVSEPSDCLFRVDEGTVGIFKKDAKGEDTIVGYVGAGEYMGEMSLMLEEPHSSKAVALTDVILSVHTREDIEEMLERTPMPITRLLTDLITRLSKANEVIRQNSLQNGLHDTVKEILEENSRVPSEVASVEAMQNNVYDEEDEEDWCKAV